MGPRTRSDHMSNYNRVPMCMAKTVSTSARKSQRAPGNSSNHATASPTVAPLPARRDSSDSLLVTGHMATYSIGINRVIRGLEGQGLEVTRTSGVVAGR